MECLVSETRSLHIAIMPILQISHFLVIAHRSGMERHAQRAFFRAMAEIFHVERPVVVHRNDLFSFVDGFDGRIGDAVGQPFVRHQRPAAIVDGQGIFF